MEFNERLKALRKKADLTQSDFADKTGVHFQTVSKWERGASAPDISALSVIAKTLNVTLEGLLGVEESDSPITGDFDATSMAKALADYRKNKGLSQSELSEQLDVTPDAVSKWERG
ncbi:MAG: helix-turn-helix domain-containing protein, partial [Clostridia bacterium]|nr:helix-turn-helix domain-containing protein [Clostridia bacterium]